MITVTAKITRFQPPISDALLRSNESHQKAMQRQAELDRKLMNAIFDRNMRRPWKVKGPLNTEGEV